MNNKTEIYILGEVLIDCFPQGEEILGGAPFNVAWHLHALGDEPCFISRIGKDAQGDRILQNMRASGMNTAAVQVDEKHPTGRVEVTFHDREPSYNIIEDCAYDFISADEAPTPDSAGILYHGTLCLRNETSRAAYHKIYRNGKLKVFLDVNLRSPWWHREEVFQWLENAHWVKMNEDELHLLLETEGGLRSKMAELQASCNLDQLIVTRGEKGTMVRTVTGDFHSLVPEKVSRLVDTVGAGDAFSAVYIHGLQAGWPIEVNLQHAQQFASNVLGLRGATTTDPTFYQEFKQSISQ